MITSTETPSTPPLADAAIEKRPELALDWNRNVLEARLEVALSRLEIIGKLRSAGGTD